jgi:hypothetical protein
VNQDMIVTVTLKGGASATQHSTGAQTGFAQGSVDPPPPMAFDALQSTGALGAPAPRSLDQLSMLSSEQAFGGGSGDGAPPPPLTLDRLQSGSSHAAPSPADFGALSTALGPPSPVSLATLGSSGSAAGLPTPHEQDTLGGPGGEGDGSGPSAGAKKRDR